MLKFPIFIFLLLSCTDNPSQTHSHTETEKYTCPMHPQVVQDKPGTCPICGMDLVKVTKSDSVSSDLMLTDSQIKLANITTQKVTSQKIGQTITVNGRLALNQQNTQVISARTAGRIEKLFFKETGRAIEKGEPLYTLYSETLLTLQQEYLLAKEQYETLGKTEERYKSFFDAAARKLELYGLTRKQISNLKKENLESRITFLSPSSGIITEINVAEGQYVEEGSDLYRIEDIGELWIEAELYPAETALVKLGDKVNVRVNGNQSAIATVTFLSPAYRSNSQVMVMRASIDNPGNKLKPGQQVHVYLTHSSKEAIAIPVDAVIRDGKGTHVYVQKGINTFRPQMVKTGIETFEYVEITEGLAEGDTVAITGAYLLYSEIVLKKGAHPMQGH